VIYPPFAPFRQGWAVLSSPQLCLLLRYANAQIRATIARFYMMTQTSLSAATKAERGDPCAAARLKWHRHSCLCAVPIWQSRRPRLPHRIATLKHQEEAEAHINRHKFLIANLELEFNVSPIRINDLKFSNRKFSAIFHYIFPSPNRPSPHPVILLAPTHEGKASDQDTRPEGSQLRSHFNPATTATSETSNRDTAIKNPHNLHKTKPIPIPNRDKSATLCSHNPSPATPTTFRPFPPLC
jgi:hypothetical protein